jgi:hypothetical protein
MLGGADLLLEMCIVFLHFPLAHLSKGFSPMQWQECGMCNAGCTSTKYPPTFFKENEKLEVQVRSQKRVIDKLKDEQRSTAARKPVLQLHNPPSTKGKENVDHSLVWKSPVSSPNVKSLRRDR